MSMKEIALSYLRKNLSVIPLWSPEMVRSRPPQHYVDALNKALADNQKRETPRPEEEIRAELFTRQCKLPLVKWTEFQSRRATEQEIIAWFEKWPGANIGIVTGEISNLVVFDLDSEDAVSYAEDQGGFPDTVKVKSGKGYHVYVLHPGFEIRNSVNKKLDIDIRADGGYAAAPPSLHGSGHQYQWMQGFSIFEIDPAPCEPWMVDYLRSIAEAGAAPKKTKEPAVKPSENLHTVRTVDGGNEYADILEKGAVAGNRNHIATKLAGHLLAKGIDEGEAWQMIRMWNLGKNSPPIDEGELRKTFDSIAKLELGKENEKEVKVETFLDTPEKVISEYSAGYVRIPFAGDGKLKILENKLNGGLSGGSLYIWGGIPSSGKTGLLNNIADNICLQGHPVLFFSYDDGVTELRYRSFSRFSGFDIESFNQNKLGKSDIEAIARNPNITKISACKYVVWQMINVESWPPIIEQIISRHQKAPVIIIDYLRKLRTKDKQGDERLRVDSILSSLTQMAKTYNTPVLAISELARDSYKSGQRLSMASFKESGSIEYEASWLGILAAVEDNGDGYNLKNDWERIIQQDGTVDLIVFKAKRGTGETGKIGLKMDKNKMVFRDRIETGKLDTVTQLKQSKFA